MLMNQIRRMAARAPSPGSSLAAVLPDLVDAVSPSREVINANRLARDIGEASIDDDRSAGAFGSRVH
jgi:hypothetical protein